MTKYLVKCPKCGKEMTTEPKFLRTSIKKCVYCGKLFRVYKNVNKNQIIMEEK